MRTTFDRIDAAILTALQKDGRLSNKELAAKVGLAPSSCLERVRRLKERGALRGFRAEVDPEALGIGLQAMIALQLRPHTAEVLMAFRDKILEYPEVIAAYYMAGANDFLVHVAVRDAVHLRDLVLRASAGTTNVVHVQTSLIFEHHTAETLPNYNVDGD